VSNQNLFPNDEVRQVGFSLLSEYQNGLFPEIEKILQPKYGNDWFQKCLSEEKWKGKNPSKDLYTLLKEVVDFNNHNFRLAIAKSMFGKHVLTAAELEEIGKIFKYRNKWAHDQSDTENQVNLTDLRDLTRLVKKYAMNESTKLSCEEILKSKDARDLILSIPAVSRNLPENFRTTEQMAKIVSLFKNNKIPQDSSPEMLIEMQDGLRTTFHAWQRTQLRLDYLLLHHRFLQVKIMAKILVDANSFSEEFSNESLGNFEFNDKSTEFELMDEIQQLSANLSLHTGPLVKQIERQVEEILEAHEKLSKSTGERYCVCDYCAIDPHGFGPFYQSDQEVKQFLEEEVFNRAFGVRFIKLLNEDTDNDEN
jgi:hypothetical protein